ncbi:MAG: O-antigen ligase family protein [Anaerolineaceae bacterium]
MNIQENYAQRQQTVILVLALLLTVAAAASGLLVSSTFAPIFVGLGLASLLLLAVGLSRPWLVLYVAIFVIFIPDGILPAEIQSYLNRGLTVLVFAVWAFDLFIKRKKIYLPLPSMVMVAFLAWAALSIAWAGSMGDAITIFQRYILRFLLFLFLGVNLIDTRKKLNGLMYTMALIGFLLVIAAIVTLLIEGYTPGTRFSIMGMNENSVGIMLLMSLMGVLWWASQPSKHGTAARKLIGILYLIISVGLVAISGSRGSAISMVGTLILLFAWKSTRYWGMVTLLVVLIGMVAAPVLFLTTFDRFQAAGYSGDTTLGGRESLWQTAWLVVRDHPLLGVGLGNGYLQMKYYFSDSSVQSYLMPLQVWDADSISPHNPVLAIWMDVGAIGLAIYLGIIFTAMLVFFRSYWRHKNSSLQLYYGFVIAVFIGYFLSWVKGGGMESDHSFFMMIMFLIIPEILDKSEGIGRDEQAKAA